MLVEEAEIRPLPCRVEVVLEAVEGVERGFLFVLQFQEIDQAGIVLLLGDGLRRKEEEEDRKRQGRHPDLSEGSAVPHVPHCLCPGCVAHCSHLRIGRRVSVLELKEERRGPAEHLGDG